MRPFSAALWAVFIWGNLFAPCFLLAAPDLNIDSKYKKSCTASGCHAKPVVTGSPLHVPYLEEQCNTCHTDHASSSTLLLKEGEDKLCLSCHTGIETNSEGHVRHAGHGMGENPEAQANCTDCHDPHGGRIRNLLRDEKLLASCSECHSSFLESGKNYPYTHGYFNPEAQCGFCHYAHQKSENAFLRENVGESCLTCHDLSIRTRGRNLENVGMRMRSARMVHGALGKGSCADCHTPHGSIQASLLKKGYPAGNYSKYQSEQYSLCWRCHPSKLAESANGAGATNFRNGQKNLHRLHLAQLGRGRACHLCHAAHASDQPHLLREEVVFNKWKSPFKFRALPDGGTCTTACHREKPYHR